MPKSLFSIAFVLLPMLGFAAKDRPTFSVVDEDQDGALTTSELQRYAEKERSEHFEARRTNMLSQTRKRLPSLIKKMDTDGNGKLSKDEFPGHAPILPKFEAFDSNKDGHLELEEFMDYQRSIHPKEVLILRSVNNLVDKADKSGDGQLSKHEFSAAGDAIEHAFFHKSVHSEL